jgi:hypothetical protein
VLRVWELRVDQWVLVRTADAVFASNGTGLRGRCRCKEDRDRGARFRPARSRA